MRHEELAITGVRHLGYIVRAVYHMGHLVWQAARACFSRGWDNDLPWHPDEGWSND